MRLVPAGRMKLLTFLFLLPLAVFAADKQPNIIFIMADDLGWTDVACFGSKYYETPNIDKLATQGMKLTRHHHCQNCQPTRAALMTGQYAARTGVYTVGGIDRFDWSSRPLRPADNVTELPLEKTIVASLSSHQRNVALSLRWLQNRRASSSLLLLSLRPINYTKQ